MTPNTKYSEAISYLDHRINYETFQTVPYKAFEDRLEALRDILDFLDSPDKKYKIAHVAGTKGKGSTCIFLEQILCKAGYRTGCFNSPHLHSPMERFMIGGVPCDENLFVEIFFDLKNRIEKWESTSPIASSLQFPITYFEWTTIFALEYFARQNVEIAVVEVGLGGRLDSTNVCLPAVSIISNISYDHIEQLGPTLSDIAREKAGIIKPGIPVVSGVCKPEPADTIRTVAASRNAPIYEWGRDFTSNLHRESLPLDRNPSIVFDFTAESKKFTSPRHWRNLESPVLGEHQSRNASLALTAAILLEEQGLKIPEEAVRRGLQSVRLPARVEVCSQNPLIIIDGANNRESVQELIETLKTYCRSENSRKILLFGSLLGKDNEGMLQELVTYFDWIIFTQPPINSRSFPAQGLCRIATSIVSKPRQKCPDIGEIIPNVNEAFAKAKALAKAEDLICVTGSFYLAAGIRECVSFPT